MRKIRTREHVHTPSRSDGGGPGVDARAGVSWVWRVHGVRLAALREREGARPRSRLPVPQRGGEGDKECVGEGC